MTSDEATLTMLLTHVQRRNIVRALLEAGERRSPSELAVELDEALAGVIYHVRRLVEFDALRLDGTKESRGSVKHFYVLGQLIERNRDFVTVFLATE